MAHEIALQASWFDSVEHNVRRRRARPTLGTGS
jgi:hypothetical protein